MRLKSSSYDTRNNKKSHKLDLLVPKIYSSAALHMCIANYQAIMGAYHQFILEKFQALIAVLPLDQKSLAISFH